MPASRPLLVPALMSHFGVQAVRRLCQRAPGVANCLTDLPFIRVTSLGYLITFHRLFQAWECSPRNLKSSPRLYTLGCKINTHTGWRGVRTGSVRKRRLAAVCEPLRASCFEANSFFLLLEVSRHTNASVLDSE